MLHRAKHKKAPRAKEIKMENTIIEIGNLPARWQVIITKSLTVPNGVNRGTKQKIASSILVLCNIGKFIEPEGRYRS